MTMPRRGKSNRRGEERAMHHSDNRNLIDALRAAAHSGSDRRITMYDGRCRPVSDRSYQDFLDAARAMAGRLSARGVVPGDRVLICLPNSWDWLDCWLGAVWLGAMPVAASPGLAMGSGSFLAEKTFGIAEPSTMPRTFGSCGAAKHARLGVACAPRGRGGKKRWRAA